MIEAVLFDFNGVLLLDSKWHEEAWNKLAKKLRDKSLSSEEMRKEVHGRIPQDTLRFLLQREPTKSESRVYLDQKEEFYKKVALGKEQFKLTSGSIRFFEHLDKNNIKKTIATSSPPVLIEFYYKYLNLEKWFARETIVYNDGSFPGKPAPDIFLRAAEKLEVNISSCLVIEDASSGVEAAKNAGVAKTIFYLNGENSETARRVKVDKVVNSFQDIIPELL